jgi:DeoR/GlpR family transcriptional regulator of sugar metabolism
MSQIARLRDIHKIITDKDISPEIEEQLRNSGCELILV